MSAIASVIRELPSSLTYTNISHKIRNNEYLISSIATAALASSVLVATGGSLTLGFFAVKLLSGAFYCFINHHVSAIAVGITEIFVKMTHSCFASADSINSFNAAINTIHSSTFYKTVKAALNIFTTVIPLAFSSNYNLSMNIYLSLAFLTVGSILLMTGALSSLRINASYRNNLAYIRQGDEMGNVFHLLTGGLINGGDFYANAVQYGNDARHTEAQALTGDSPTIINRAITKYIASLPEGERRDEFQEELESSSADAFITIAHETMLEIITTLPAPGMFSTPNYPSIILEQNKVEFSGIHRKFSSLSVLLQNEVKQNIHREGGPVNPLAKAVWTSLRTYREKLIHGNPIFFAAVQQTLETRAQH